MNLSIPDPPEVHLAKQVEAILYSFAKFQELKLLTEMNGRNCANKQLSRLQVYERRQRKAA